MDHDIIKLEYSESNHPTISVNGHYLHSIHDPMAEGCQLVAAHIDVIKKKNHLLILGLGLGYHLIALKEELRKYHEYSEILVIEKSQQIYDKFSEVNFKELKGDDITIIVDPSVSSLYQNAKLCDFLTRSPGIICHPASFNLKSQYYSDFLKFRPEKKWKIISEKIENKSLKNDLLKFFQDQNDEHQDLAVYIKKIKNNHKNLSNTDCLLLAYDEIIHN